MNKIVIVSQKTRLQELIERFNTKEQAQFYVEHLGADFSDYLKEDQTYNDALKTVRLGAEKNARVSMIDKTFVHQYLFGKQDVVICVGRDGLVCNTMKYLESTNPVIGVNPDPDRWDGVVLPYEAGEVEVVSKKVLGNPDSMTARQITFALARTQNGQELYAANDLFIGPSSHISARYDITFWGRTEYQSSSGVIVSTGLGQSGWYRSIVEQIRGGAEFLGMEGVEYDPLLRWEDRALTFAVREPYPSNTTKAGIVMGAIMENETLRMRSNMPEKGIIFSDGIESDFIEFNSGTEVVIGVAEKSGHLIVGH